MARYDIFISYSLSDSLYKDELTHALRQNGLTIFSDSEVTAGNTFTEQIKEAIEKSTVVVVLWGERSIDSLWNRREIEFAQSLNKQIIVIPLTAVHDIPPFLLNYERLLLTLKNKAVESVAQALYRAREQSNSAHIEQAPTQTSPVSRKNGNSIFRQKWVCFGIIIFVVLLLCFLLLNQISYEAPPMVTNPPMEDTYPCDEWNMVDTIAADTVAADIPGMSPAAYDTVIVGFPEKPAIADDTIAVVSPEAPVQSDIYETEPHPEAVPEKSSWSSWSIGIVFFFIGCVTTLTVVRMKRKNVKISSDVDVSVSIDSKHKSELKAGEVLFSKLDKGEYIIACQPKSKDYNCKRIVHHVDNSESKVIYTRFLEEPSKITSAKTIKCFIAGSTSLQTERDALRSVMAQMYNQWESMNFRIMSYTFEDFTRSVVIGGHQKLYDKFIEEDADWVFFIIADGVGDKTLHEYKLSLESFKKNGHPKIMCFAKEGVTDDPNVKSMKEVQLKENLYWYPYSDLENLKLKFSQTLSWDLTLLYHKNTNQ